MYIYIYASPGFNELKPENFTYPTFNGKGNTPPKSYISVYSQPNPVYLFKLNYIQHIQSLPLLVCETSLGYWVGASLGRHKGIDRNASRAFRNLDLSWFQKIKHLTKVLLNSMEGPDSIYNEPSYRKNSSPGMGVKMGQIAVKFERPLSSSAARRRPNFKAIGKLSIPTLRFLPLCRILHLRPFVKSYVFCPLWDLTSSNLAGGSAALLPRHL